jgi:hypothetical protein
MTKIITDQQNLPFRKDNNNIYFILSQYVQAMVSLKIAELAIPLQDQTELMS